ncbi:hypothetical protein MUG78_17215 [Gordonia alkaliphila]|uniref:hypothetical protein n=1 Tax=Gordonia alkaliphila TaxID=1053547 RepID=UPI001FF11D57|nr:hypothetical protein [Gordonia alkaliphila]MCK0441142.1 hypothetical protein [Gordonia alkaliphila]
MTLTISLDGAALEAIRYYRQLRAEDEQTRQRGHSNADSWRLEASRIEVANLVADLVDDE